MSLFSRLFTSSPLTPLAQFQNAYQSFVTSTRSSTSIQHLNEIVDLLLERGTQSSVYEEFLKEGIFHNLASIALQNRPNGLRREILRAFTKLLAGMEETFLVPERIHGPLLKLIKKCGERGDRKTECEEELVDLCYHIAEKCKMKRELIYLVMTPRRGAKLGKHRNSKGGESRSPIDHNGDRILSEETDADSHTTISPISPISPVLPREPEDPEARFYDFVVFEYLLRFLAHPAGTFLGETSRNALITWAEIDEPYLQEYIIEESGFIGVCAAGLGAVWSDMPSIQGSKPYTDDAEYLASSSNLDQPEVVLAVSPLETFFAFWDFLQQLLFTTVQPKLSASLLDQVANGFFQNIMFTAAITPCKEILGWHFEFGTQATQRAAPRPNEDDLGHGSRTWETWAVVKEMVERCNNPDLADIICKFLLAEDAPSCRSLRPLLLSAFEADQLSSFRVLGLTIITSLLTFHPISTLRYLTPKLCTSDYRCTRLGTDMYAHGLERWWSLLPEGQGAALLNVEYDRYLRDAIINTEFAQKRAKFNGWKGIEAQESHNDPITNTDESNITEDLLLRQVYTLIHHFADSTIQTQLAITGLVSALLAHPNSALQTALLSNDLIHTGSQSLFTEVQFATNILLNTQTMAKIPSNLSQPMSATPEVEGENELLLLRKRGEVLGIASPFKTPQKHRSSAASIRSLTGTPEQYGRPPSSPVRLEKGDASTQLSRLKVISNSDLGSEMAEGEDMEVDEVAQSTSRSILILEEMVKETIALIQVQRSLGNGVRYLGSAENSRSTLNLESFQEQVA